MKSRQKHVKIHVNFCGNLQMNVSTTTQCIMLEKKVETGSGASQIYCSNATALRQTWAHAISSRHTIGQDALDVN